MTWMVHYRVPEKLAEHRMDAVHRAHQTKLGRDVALERAVLHWSVTER